MTYYEELAYWYTKARSQKLGRPLASWGRVIREDENYRFYAQQGYNPEPFGLLTPDNVFTFLYTGMQVARVSNTLTSSLNNTMPFAIQRVAKHRYNVVHDKLVPPGVHRWESPKLFGYEMYPGIQFDMATGQCLNPLDPVERVVNPDARRVWLRALRKFKRQMYTRAKLGLFDSYVAQIRSSTMSGMNRQRPDWTSDEWLDVLYAAFKDDQYSDTLLVGIAKHALARQWYQVAINYAHIIASINDVCTITSLDLRRRFGVFEEK